MRLTPTSPELRDAVHGVSRSFTDLGKTLRVHAKATTHEILRDVEAKAKRAHAEVRALRARLAASRTKTTTRGATAARGAKVRVKSAWRELTKKA